jgi:predicted NUDIX family phosphoesterase
VETKPSTYLEASAAALEKAGRPLTSKEIALFVKENIAFKISGRTPWKTINARISTEILKNGSNSTFVRIEDGRFALRRWPNTDEYKARRRNINPIEETIAVLPREQFLAHLRTREGSRLFDLNYTNLLQDAHGMPRRQAEETDDFVQIIPLFFVQRDDLLLTYKRTKRLPEKRLHGTRSINFGGHMQLEDFPTLFASDPSIIDQCIQRELREELLFEPEERTVEFMGAIHDDSNMFGRQHVGLSFKVTLNSSVEVESNEPGFLTSLTFMSKEQIYGNREDFDDWTFLILEEFF